MQQSKRRTDGRLVTAMRLEEVLGFFLKKSQIGARRQMPSHGNLPSYLVSAACSLGPGRRSRPDSQEGGFNPFGRSGGALQRRTYLYQPADSVSIPFSP